MELKSVAVKKLHDSWDYIFEMLLNVLKKLN